MPSPVLTAWGRLLLAAVPLLVPAPGLEAAEAERRLGAMGTSLTLRVEAPSREAALAASERAVRAVEAAEARLSTWRAGTPLAAVNAAPEGAPYPVPATLAAELSAALACAAATGGAFDPTVGALVAAWGLRGAGRRPGEAELGAALARTGYAKVTVAGSKVVRQGGVVIEEGGFGKGAGLDAALAALSAAGVTSAAVDFGGQFALVGTHEVALAHPRRRGRPVARLRLDGGSLAVSGNSERPGHLLDPRSGRPARDFGAVAVWAPGALEADCLSTALFVLGPEAALAWAGARPDVGVAVLEESQGRVRLTLSPRLAGRLAWRADGVEVVSPGR